MEKRTVDIPGLNQKAHDATPRHYDTVRPWCNTLLNQKQWAEGEKCGAELIKLDPGRAAGYSALVFSYANQQKWKELDAILAEAEKNDPDGLSPFFQAGLQLALSGADNARAERYLRKYLTQEPEPNANRPSRAHWRLGQVLEKQGRKAEAIAEIQLATTQEPAFEPAKTDLKRLQGQ